MKWYMMLLGLCMAPVAWAGAMSASLAGKVSVSGPSAAIGGTGTLAIETQGEHATQPVATAPYVTVWTDGQTPTLKTFSKSGIAAGTAWSRSEYPWGLTPHVGTCTYAEGGGGCTVSSFTRLFDLPTGQWGCDTTQCRYQVTLTGGQVTKVAWRWIGEYEGFGATTVGGRNGTICNWTNLNDNGAGSLRNCISNGANSGTQGTYQDDVYVVCQVTGTLALSPSPTPNYGPIIVKGRNITIDGYTCPGPVTLTNYGIWIKSAVSNTPPVNRDVHDIIIRNLAIRSMYSSIENCSAGQPCLSGWSTAAYTGETSERNGASVPPYNIVFSNLSISGSLREPYTGIFLTNNVTLQYNVYAHQVGFRQGTLFDEVSQHTMHHTVLSNTGARNPQAVYDHGPAVDPDTTLDYRFNLFGMAMNPNTGFWGLNLTHGVKANIVGNYFIGLPTVGATLTTVCSISDAAGTSCGAGPLDTLGPTLAGSWSFCYGPGGGGNSNNWQGACGKSESLCDIYGQYPVAGVYSTGNTITSAYNTMPPCNINQNTPNVSNPYTAPTVTGTNALAEACVTKAIAGRWPRDSWDTTELGLINLVGCSAFSLGSGA